MKTILVVATLDTKGMEVAFSKENIEALGAKALLLDAGILGSPTIIPDITREEVAVAAGSTLKKVRTMTAEAEALGVMTQGASNIAVKLHEEGKIHGVLGIGGGMGTAMGTGVMRSLPIGVPKFMVSPQAGNPDVVGAAVGTKDICMFHSVTDVVGLNPLLRTIFSKACGGVVGMANAEVRLETSYRKTVAVCAKGTTEAANRIIRDKLADAGYQPMTFHCFGYGPASLEQIIKDGYIDGGVIELASDWLDRIGGGASFPPADRYENVGERGIPMVFVPGSCDFIAAAPGKFPGRTVQPHNRAVSLYRSSKEELAQLAQEVGEKLAKSKGPVTVVIPLKGFCVHDREGGPLYDPEANAAFIEGISAFEGKFKIKKVDAHINDERFIDAILEAFQENFEAAMPVASRPIADKVILTLTGYAASCGLAVGPCKKITNIEDVRCLDNESILVVKTASPALARLIPGLRGLICDQGGPLSTASIYAREYGVPAAVGVNGIFEALNDGDLIRLDGMRGTIEVLAR